MSPRLSVTSPPPSQAGKREWHPEGQGTAERKAPVSCLTGSKGPGVGKGGIFRSDLTPPTCPSSTLSWWLQLLQAGHSEKRVNSILDLGCCHIIKGHVSEKFPGKTTPDPAGHSMGTHHTQDYSFLGVTQGYRKNVSGGGMTQPPPPGNTASSPPGQ